MPLIKFSSETSKIKYEKYVYPPRRLLGSRIMIRDYAGELSILVKNVSFSSNRPFGTS